MERVAMICALLFFLALLSPVPPFVLSHKGAGGGRHSGGLISKIAQRKISPTPAVSAADDDLPSGGEDLQNSVDVPLTADTGDVDYLDPALIDDSTDDEIDHEGDDQKTAQEDTGADDTTPQTYAAIKRHRANWTGLLDRRESAPGGIPSWLYPSPQNTPPGSFPLQAGSPLSSLPIPAGSQQFPFPLPSGGGQQFSIPIPSGGGQQFSIPIPSGGGQQFSIPIPSGGGQQFSIPIPSGGGQQFSIPIPSGEAGGQQLSIPIPSGGGQQFSIPIPSGGGQQFSIPIPSGGGQQFSIPIPSGEAGGQQFPFPLPSSGAPSSSSDASLPLPSGLWDTNGKGTTGNIPFYPTAPSSSNVGGPRSPFTRRPLQRAPTTRDPTPAPRTETGRQRAVWQPKAATATSFSGGMLEAHNKYRTDAGLGALEWDNSLANKIAEYLKIADGEGCPLKHSSMSKFRKQVGQFRKPGENLWKGNYHPDAAKAASHWYNELYCYDYGATGNGCTTNCNRECRSKSVSCQTGHFTMMMWETVTHIGCSEHQCASRPGYWLVGCHYGSTITPYGGNVLRELPFNSKVASNLGLSQNKCDRPRSFLLKG